MTSSELEAQLRRLGTDWPFPSVADAVLARIESRSVAPPRRASRLRRRAAPLAAAAAVLALAAAAAWLFVVAAPATLQAQVQQALQKARAAHIVVSTPDDKGVRQQRGEIWYERGRGFRAELPEEVIVDDGRHQWTWRPGIKEGERVIARRASRDAAGMITGLFQLGDAPAAWARQRAPEHDRAIGGRPCRGFVVTPPVPPVANADGSDLVPDPHPPRFVVLIDPDERVVHLQEQRQVDGRWQAGREVSLAYDVAVPAEKLAANLPAGRVIDADRALEERFPVEKALAQAEADGLLFAVHELQRGPDEMFYVVSSVRGTPEFLKDHPPRRRRVNLQVTLLDVAEQIAAAGTDLDCNRAVLASAEADGVHYLWWLAVRRRYFTEERGKRTPHSEAPSLEVSPGKVRVPLQAIHRGSPGVQDWVRVNVDASVAVDQPIQPLAELAARARRDALLIQQAPGALVDLRGWVKDGQMRPTSPDQITDGAFARQVSRQLEWLHSLNKVIERDPGIGPPGMLGAPGDR
jgi:hypothetical protein